MKLDYSAKPFEFLIGDFNGTSYIDSFKISCPKSGDNPLVWVGDFEIAFTYDAQVSGLTHAAFDPDENPNRWRPAMALISISISGYPLPKFRIKKYTYNFQTRIGKGNLTQILDIFGGDIPGIVAESGGTTVESAAKTLLEAAFKDSGITPTITLANMLPRGYIDEDINTRDPIQDAQKLIGTGFHWLYVDTTETIRNIPGDPTGKTPVFYRAIDEIEWDPDHEGEDNFAEKLIVTGSRKVLPTTGVTIKVLNKTQDESHDTEGRQIKLVVPTYKKRSALFPDLFPNDTSDVLAEEKTTIYRYFGISTDIETFPPVVVENSMEYLPDIATLGYKFGELVQTKTSIKKTRGEVFGDVFPGDTGMIEAQIILESDFAKAEFLSRGELIPDQFPGDSSMMLSKVEAIKSGRVEADGTVRNQKGKDGGPLELEKRYRREYTFTKPKRELVQQNLKGECNLKPNGWTPVRNKPLVKDLGFIPSQAHADFSAIQHARKASRDRDSVNVTMPLPVEWLIAGCVPLSICNIHNAQLEIELPIIVYAQEKLSFSFTGAKIGTIPTIQPLPDPIPYIPTNALQIVPSSPLRLTVGVSL